MTRYDNLNLAMRELAGRDAITFVEVGTYDGVRAGQLINFWHSFRPGRKLVYHGFDLFEDLTPEMSKAELSKSKLPPSMEQVYQRLRNAVPPTTSIYLHKGNTRETLHGEKKRGIKADLIFMDGGHSLYTVAQDWLGIQSMITDDTIVLLDDYYVNRLDYGVGNLVEMLRVNKNFTVTLLDPVDHFDHTKLDIRMVKVVRRAWEKESSGVPSNSESET